MELNAVAERSSAARFTRRRFCETDPQECGGLRQGNIALIHSRSQEKDFLMVRRCTQASVRSLRKLGYGAVSNHEVTYGPASFETRPSAAPQDKDEVLPS